MHPLRAEIGAAPGASCPRPSFMRQGDRANSVIHFQHAGEADALWYDYCLFFDVAVGLKVCFVLRIRKILLRKTAAQSGECAHTILNGDHHGAAKLH
jgi:hypothetical protein